MLPSNRRLGAAIWEENNMRLDDDGWLSVADAFNAAGTGAGSWYDALNALAEVTGSRSSQLVGVGSSNAVPFNVVTGVPSEWERDFAASGGGDPQRNPIIGAALATPELNVVTTAQFLPAEVRRRNEFMQWQERHYELRTACLTPLIKDADMHVGIAVLRTNKQGEIGARQRAVFASIAPHIRAAVRAQIAMEHQGAPLIAGAMEALSQAVFVCDARGTVKAMSPAAEALVLGGDLRLKNGVLGSSVAVESRALREAIAVAVRGVLRPGAPAASSVLVTRGMDVPLMVEVVPLPRRDFSFGFEPRALVVARGTKPAPARIKELLRMTYELTATEAEIVSALVGGEAPKTLAYKRGVAVGTVRSQIRSIYAKVGVTRLSELIARVNALR